MRCLAFQSLPRRAASYADRRPGARAFVETLTLIQQRGRTPRTHLQAALEPPPPPGQHPSTIGHSQKPVSSQKKWLNNVNYK